MNIPRHIPPFSIIFLIPSSRHSGPAQQIHYVTSRIVPLYTVPTRTPIYDYLGSSPIDLLKDIISVGIRKYMNEF